jgi:hypothetical protein
MTNRELVIETLAHRNPGKVPQAIHLTGEAYQAYGEALLRDYPHEQARRDYEAGVISLDQAVSLSIGNHILHVYAPWWDWYNLTDVFLKEPDPPDYLPDTRGSGSYEHFFKQLAHIREHYDVYTVVTIWGSHWEKAYFARGIKNFLADLAGSPEWARALIRAFNYDFIWSTLIGDTVFGDQRTDMGHAVYADGCPGDRLQG